MVSIKFLKVQIVEIILLSVGFDLCIRTFSGKAKYVSKQANNTNIAAIK